LEVKDSNGNQLSDGDSVQVIKDLKVKGTSVTLKRGTIIKNIRLTSDEDEIECNAEKVKGLVLKTCRPESLPGASTDRRLRRFGNLMTPLLRTARGGSEPESQANRLLYARLERRHLARTPRTGLRLRPISWAWILEKSALPRGKRP